MTGCRPELVSGVPKGGAKVYSYQPKDPHRKLIQDVRDGKENAIETFHRTFFRYAYRLAREILGRWSADEAEDVAKRVTAKAYKGLELFDGRCWYTGYYKKIAINAAVDRYNRLKTRRIPSAAKVTLDDPEAPVEAEGREPDPAFAAAVKLAIERLPEAERLALVLRWKSGLTYDEMAECLRTTPAAAKQRVYRARRLLRVMLRRRGYRV